MPAQIVVVVFLRLVNLPPCLLNLLLRCSHVSVFLTNSYTRFLLRKENRTERERGAQRHGNHPNTLTHKMSSTFVNNDSSLETSTAGIIRNSNSFH
jgi:hypothetical protein